MVKLIWKNKTSPLNLIDERKEEFKDIFKKTNINSIFKTSDKNLKWNNKLFWGENLEVLYYLLNNYENKIDLIYVDPPFFSGSNYHIQVKEEGKGYETVAYHDHWNKELDSYLQMLYERIILFRELLSDKGILFMHLDWHASHYIKLILDEIFGQNRFLNNIVWYYYNKYSSGKKALPRAHDDILVYTKTENYKINEIRIPREKPIRQLKRVMVNGVLKNAKDQNGKVIYRTVTDKKLDDVWTIPCMQPASKEWTGYPTQKHHDLLERIILLGSNKGDLIADFFCGSGTTLLAGERLERRWIGADVSKYAIYLTLKRLRETPEILTNLTEERIKIINSGFFKKNLIIKRKK
ncbi:MAG: DNA methyltransferase [Promethearchaeota archaeon]